MKGIIFYFSGTGNTEFVAKQCLKYLQTSGYDMVLQAIDRIKTIPNLEDYDLIGFGFPLYAWNLPINVRKFIEDLPNCSSKNSFVFATAGGPTALGALGIAKDLLKKKGFCINAAECFEMPSNDNIIFDADDPKSNRSVKLRWLANEKAKEFVKTIQTGKGKISGDNLFMKFLSFVTGFWLNKLYRPYFHYHKFYVDEKCRSNCRLCEQTCPVNNIKKIGPKDVLFDRACILCARCINCCPVSAIQYGKSKGKHRFKDLDYHPPILRE
ncbi:MAG: EFR1 family ferrodoxin [candidate division WOR-3 bacterium]